MSVAVLSVERHDGEVEIQVEAIGGLLLLRGALRAGDRLTIRTRHRIVGIERAVLDGTAVVVVPALVLPRAWEVTALLHRGGHRTVLATITGTAHVDVVAAPGAARPLLVAGLARGGTTLLMRLLREHPSLLVVDAYPYEQRHAAVLTHQLLATAVPGIGAAALPAGSVGHLAEPGALANPYFRPNLPLFDYLAGEHLEARAGATMDLVERLYREVGAQGGRAPDATHFVEKFVPPALTCALEHCFGEVRELVLVRDARDAATSQRSFNERRGFDGFGIGEDDVVALAERIAATHLQHHRERVDVRDADHVALVRYEDLATDPASTLGGALAAIGLGVDDSVLEAMVGAALGDEVLKRSHMTSASAAASIGRWREAVDISQHEALDRSLRAFDRMFGYGAWADQRTA